MIPLFIRRLIESGHPISISTNQAKDKGWILIDSFDGKPEIGDAVSSMFSAEHKIQLIPDFLIMETDIGNKKFSSVKSLFSDGYFVFRHCTSPSVCGYQELEPDDELSEGDIVTYTNVHPELITSHHPTDKNGFVIDGFQGYTVQKLFEKYPSIAAKKPRLWMKYDAPWVGLAVPQKITVPSCPYHSASLPLP